MHLPKQQPRNLHGQNLQHRTAGHHIEPDLPDSLCPCNGRGNGSDHNQRRTDTADYGGDADEREQPRGAAAVNGMLDGFVESVPRRSEAADHQAEYQQKRST